MQTNLACSIGQPTATEDMCTFAIQSVVCDSITGNLSAPVAITLKGLKENLMFRNYRINNYYYW